VAGTATGAAATFAVAGSAPATAAAHDELAPDRFGVLVDTPLCIGCRRCEWACARQNHLPYADLPAYDDTSVFSEVRRPDAERLTVINRYPARVDGTRHLDVKVNCLHCEHPACVSACIVGALEKDPRGPVVYNTWECIGCRYCLVACPFQIPAYEYDNALTPRVMKCNLCAERTLNGGVPACVEVCPREALVFGKRDELLELARQRIRDYPDRYVPHIYGEHEVGGTSWLYLADRSFPEIHLPDLPDRSPCEVTEGIQHGIFKGFSGPLMLFGLLGVLMKSSSDRRKEVEDGND
jgi:Fe-S-cluster-containing dehydrogenase component